jgi:galactokinase
MPKHPFDSFEVTAPGRVNLIGEHTDYNDGFVLPMAIDRAIRVRVTRRPDRTAVITSERAGIVARAEFDLAFPLAPAGRGWAEYPAGVIAGYQALGFAIPGFDAAITTDLPAGGGLSSSAALEMAVATVVETLCGRSLHTSDKALLCQQAEHAFAGVPCGIMDQFAVAHGRAGHAMLLDCRSREVRHVPLPEPLTVIVIDSGVKHSLADSEYAVRRRECASAAAGLGVPALRDASREQLDAAAASLATDYEVSCPELDAIVRIAAGLPGVVGCRMTGGGFGGCVVAIAENARASEAIAAIRAGYQRTTGIDPAIFTTRAADGPSVRPLG